MGDFGIKYQIQIHIITQTIGAIIFFITKKERVV